MTTFLTILFDGVAYGMLLFVLACGLAVTLGLMNFVNLAHGAFAMTGGYVCAVLVNRYGVPFFAGLPLAFLVSAAIGFVLERLLYRHLYSRPHLDQVLFTVGLVFMSVAATDYVMGSSQVFINLPSVLQGQIDVFGVGVGRYRLMIIVICGLLTIALQLTLSRTRFGSRPGFMAVGGYDGIHLIYEALKKTGGKTDGDALVEAMKGMKWESPRGPISIDPETRDIVQNIYIRKVEKVDGELYNVEFATFEAVKDCLLYTSPSPRDS